MGLLVVVGIPLDKVVTGATFSMLLVCEVQVGISGVVIKDKCEPMSRFPYDILLGINFLARAPIALDMKNLILFHVFSSPVLGCLLSATPQPAFHGAACLYTA